ncbi:MAG: M24 family metallopeptidase, partial [Epsilonproteobacteria bacterium]|nr:M24 family metallopeptidase [Campylobacterota bacterium]
LSHLRGGMAAKEIDELCRKEISYPHSTGHGVGLEIHEYPKISSISEEKLLKNQIVTIEPGVYFEGKWGMRIEDTVLIKEKGAEALTKFDKKLLIV